MAKAVQQEFKTEISAKRFSISRMVESKLDTLAEQIERLSFGDVVWLDRMEDFYLKNEYLTERQMRVLDAITKKTHPLA